ncbi:MAG: hypothetical protein JRH20_02090, partial [Deltaproteobacteria bacterium]|nr:hypothetical protein [Deltaproteobacteria bacterium]
MTLLPSSALSLRAKNYSVAATHQLRLRGEVGGRAINWTADLDLSDQVFVTTDLRGLFEQVSKGHLVGHVSIYSQDAWGEAESDA